ncbi:MAG: hypothetical protein GY694_15825 [Gammaproteobacteria bacterium]|nr:hypothetical protein [Gammaproteobacteria bacterium]
MSNKIGKIVELLIDWDNLEFDDLGVDIMSLVDKPAIGIKWQAFAAQQFVDPKAGESEADYVSRCIPVLKEEGFDDDQAAAICYNSYQGEEFLEDNPCQSGYVAYGTKNKGGRQVPNCIPIENSEQEFETYNDYPESAKNNAQRALDWAEENGWGSCGTGVGKARANQLAKGENISEDTIARMASFARHKKNSDTPYSEGCGKLMWDAWGGTSGIEWAQNKLKKIRGEQSEFRENPDCPDGHEHQMPDGSWMCGKSHSYSKEEVDPIIEMASQVDFGEVLDYSTTIEISQSQANFSDFQDTLKAIIGLDILGKKDPKEEGEVKYRYSGPAAQREFCRAMMRLNKVYTLQEVRRMSGLNPGFGPRGASTYDIFKYKGGPNCQHYWEQVRVFRDGRRTVVVSEGKASGLAGEAPERMPNNGYLMSKWNFSDDDQMIITGPAMTPNTLIPRKDEKGNVFHVYFTEDTIKKISKKFFEYNKLHNTDVNHDNDVTTDNTLLESWIVEDPEMDKSKKYGFDVPAGSWMVSYKINDKETWQKIKDGELNGFSIAGNFIERASKK